MKKRICLGLVLLLVFSLCACGKNSDEKAQSGELVKQDKNEPDNVGKEDGGTASAVDQTNDTGDDSTGDSEGDTKTPNGDLLEVGAYCNDNYEYEQWLVIYEDGYGDYYSYDSGTCYVNYDETQIQVYLNEEAITEAYTYDAKTGILTLASDEVFVKRDDQEFYDWWATYEDYLLGLEGSYEAELMGTWTMEYVDTEGDITYASDEMNSKLTFFINDGTELACEYYYSFMDSEVTYVGMIPQFEDDGDYGWTGYINGFAATDGDSFEYIDDTTVVFGLEDSVTLWLYFVYQDDEFGEYTSGTFCYTYSGQ